MKRKGFTLVELLIVIVVIGILSAMMMMSSTEATTSAKVSNIVSNMRNLKTAALEFYTDNMDYFVKNPKDQLVAMNDGSSRKGQDEIRKYLGAGNNTAPDINDYTVTASTQNDYTWWVAYTIKGSDAEKASIKKKLAGRASSLGLKGCSAEINKTNGEITIPKGIKDTPYTEAHNTVLLQVR